MSNLSITPAILESDFAIIEERMRSVSGLVQYVQVDICDGKFVPSKTVGSAGCEESFIRLRQLAKENRLNVELDMMVDLDTNIKGRFKKWINAINVSGAKSVVLHYGSTNNWAEVFKTLNVELTVGLGVHVDTPFMEMFRLLNKYNFKYVQVMGIDRVGYGGQAFSDKTLGIIEAIHKELPTMPVSVDGGVNLNTVEAIKRVGVKQLAVGSAIFKADNKEEVIRLLKV